MSAAWSIQATAKVDEPPIPGCNYEFAQLGFVACPSCGHPGIYGRGPELAHGTFMRCFESCGEQLVLVCFDGWGLITVEAWQKAQGKAAEPDMSRTCTYCAQGDCDECLQPLMDFPCECDMPDHALLRPRSVAGSVKGERE